MHEVVINLHMHTRYSDGSGSHLEIARAALKSGLDAVIITDHNVRVGGMERYLQQDGARVLLLIGEEIHDRRRLQQKDHLLVFGCREEMSTYAEDTPALLQAVRRLGGLSFIAHPIDPAVPAFREPDISWENWSISGFTGIELWNGFSELKFHMPTRLHGFFYAFFPGFLARGPAPAAVALWDALLAERLVVAIGGSDAHALHRRSGPLRRTVFPYDHHFRSVNTHVLLEQPLTGDAALDAKTIFSALSTGACFIGYDLPGSTRGFRFSAYGTSAQVTMGGKIETRGGVTLHTKVPDFAEIRLIKDGRPVQVIKYGQALTHRALEAGTYRVEAYRRHLGLRRAWILSNPIFLI